MSGPTVLLLAGEASGDQHGARLVTALRARAPSTTFFGTGGPDMATAGVELLARLDRLAVMGVTEIATRIPYLLRLERRLGRFLAESAPGLVVLIDYPGFNMRIARAAHARGIPVLYYIPPKVWAWRPERARALAMHTNRVAVILPFEVELLERLGVRATYVGHPLLDRPDDVPTRDAFCTTWGLEPSRRFLALLPGSRSKELKRHMGPFTEVARRVAARHPDVVPVFSRASGMHAGPFHDAGFPTVADTRGLLRHAEVGLVKSGTSTLEAALEDTPHVVAYRTSSLTGAVFARLRTTEHIALTNLVAGGTVVPELIQDEVRPQALTAAIERLLDVNGPERAAQLAGLERVRAALGGPGASDRVAELACGLLAGVGA